jgi:hypothetical protein
VLALALAGCEHAPTSDWERKNQPLLDKEQAGTMPALPAYPRSGALLEFEVRAGREIRYYIDGATLNVDDKGVVRYSLVVRTLSGAENVSYEGINCKSGEFRVYALGRADGTWGGRSGSWRPIAESRQPQHRVLQRQYFCQRDASLSDADDIRRALREGGNPWARNFGADSLRGLGR